MFLRWLEKWLYTGLFIPPYLPDDRWERLFLIAELATRIKTPKLSAALFKKTLHVVSKTHVELHTAVDVFIKSLRTLDDKPNDWPYWSKEAEETSIVDFVYDDRTGYVDIQEVVDTLIQKVSIIHYLFEEHSMDEGHPYFHYMDMCFRKVASDLEEVLGLAIELYHEM